jgi:pre-rRNA-processing protein TSR4
MLLLLQLNGDLPEHFPNDERRLYIFGCPRKACSRKTGSIRGLRGVRKLKVQSSRQPAKKQEEAAKQEQGIASAPKADLGSALFGAAPSSTGLSGNMNPFSTSSSSTTSASNPFAPLPPPSTLAAKPPQNPINTPDINLSETFAAKVRLSSPEPAPAPVEAGPPLPWPPQSAFPSPYPEYNLDAEYETLSRPSTPTASSNPTVVNIDEEESKSGGAADSTFESSIDKSFLRFSTRLSHNPEQVLRYEFRGFPLLYSHADAVGKLFPQNRPQGSGVRVATSSGNNRIPRCTSCGRERVFELQLVPHAITMLEEGREGIGLGKDDAGMEWGTIILGVCAGDCGPEKEGLAGWREEWIGVQWEETQ